MRFLGFEADAGHRLDGLHGIFAARGPAESITASVPSSTALANVGDPARVGTGDWIIDSIIWVAVIA